MPRVASPAPANPEFTLSEARFVASFTLPTYAFVPADTVNGFAPTSRRSIAPPVWFIVTAALLDVTVRAPVTSMSPPVAVFVPSSTFPWAVRLAASAIRVLTSASFAVMEAGGLVLPTAPLNVTTLAFWIAKSPVRSAAAKVASPLSLTSTVTLTRGDVAPIAPMFTPPAPVLPAPTVRELPKNAPSSMGPSVADVPAVTSKVAPAVLKLNMSIVFPTVAISTAPLTEVTLGTLPLTVTRSISPRMPAPRVPRVTSPVARRCPQTIMSPATLAAVAWMLDGMTVPPVDPNQPTSHALSTATSPSASMWPKITSPLLLAFAVTS